MKPYSILFVDHTAKLGGGEIALLNLLKNLDPSCVKSDVVLFSDGPLKERLEPFASVCVMSLSAKVLSAGKDTMGWRSLLQVVQLVNVAILTFRLARFAHINRYDCIHTNSLKADIIGGIAGRLSGVPVIWHLRDRIEPDYLPRAVVRLFRVAARLLPTYIVANSFATLKTLATGNVGSTLGADLMSKGRLSSVVHDGCDVADYVAGAPSGRSRRVGIVGRISPWKGQDVFIRAAAQVLLAVPGVSFEIIGGPLFGEGLFEKELKTLCVHLGVQQQVRFVGFVDDVPARLADLDVLVHASVIGEPFGQVIIEAMSASIPVVATNGGGVPEIVQNQVTGILVPMKDPDRMATAIIGLLQDPERAFAMGAAGRQRVIKHFSIKQTAKKITAIYEHILEAEGHL